MLLVGFFPSCFPAEQKAPEYRTTFSYEALSSLSPKDIPSFVYVFPPLRSAKGGKPIEKLEPIMSESGRVSDWKTSSAQSMAMGNDIKGYLKTGGYTVISFEELLAVRIPYSVLVISTFYTSPYDVPKEGTREGEAADKAVLVMIKGSLFDSELSPATKKDIIKVDGVTTIPAGQSLPNATGRTVREAYSWMAGNSTGKILIE